MKCFGRFYSKGEIFEGNFEIFNKKIVYEDLEVNLNNVKFLPPVLPEKIVCVGLNYTDHAKELNMGIPDEPIIFLKPPSSIIGHGDFIELPELPKGLERVDYEAELAVVIGRKCKKVTKKDAKEYIMGYTCFNDVTARDIQRKDGQWTRSKSFDTFAPIGPYIVDLKSSNPSNLKIQCRVNGKVVQNSTTSNLIFDVYTLVEFISNIMTLKKGDVIATGTPAGVGKLSSGDVVEVEIENIGTLKNYVIGELD